MYVYDYVTTDLLGAKLIIVTHQTLFVFIIIYSG